MPIDAQIVDGGGSENRAVITPEGAIQVVNHGHPPTTETIFLIPFRQYFTDDGTASGSNDMIVDGSSTPQEFWVAADTEKDVHIVTISVDLSDGGTPNMNKFGDLTALTNGVSVDYITQDQGTVQLHNGIKTNREFVRFGNETPAIGTGADAFLADASGGGSEKAYLPKVDVREQFGMPFGIRLRKGTNDRLVFTVNDALAGLTTFNVIAYGNKLVENN
jgi:hypothetical protein